MVDRGDREGIATLYHDGPLDAHTVSTLGDSAANHVRVRRLHVSDAVHVTNGRGVMASGTIARIARGAVDVMISECTTVPAPVALHLFAPVGDRDRMLWLAEKCTEQRITAWQPVLYQRSRSVSPRGEGNAFAGRLRSRMISALEQSGGAWLPEVGADLELRDALALPLEADRYVLDRDGAPALGVMKAGAAALIFGPEGGLTLEELAVIQERGWHPVSLGKGTLRFETAGVAAVALLRATQELQTEV